MLSQKNKMALTVLGGFLGAGKTTLLNHVLRTQQRERVLVMVNDFGSINIDAKLIARGAPGMLDGIVSLTNGCACCAIGGDLMQAFLKVLALPDPPDRVLVEASGVGDPSRIAQLGRAGGGFRSDGVLTVVDAEAVQSLAADRYVGDTVRAQLRAADLLLINKVDLVSADALARLRTWLRDEAPRVPLLESSRGEVDVRLILGPDLGPTTTDKALAPSEDDVDHAARFVSTTFSTSLPLRRKALEAALDALPPQVLRGKGLIFLEGEDAPRVLQICGRRWTLESPGLPQSNLRSRMVFVAARTPDAVPFNPWGHFSLTLADSG